MQTRILRPIVLVSLVSVTSAWVATTPSSRFPLVSSSHSARSQASFLGPHPGRRSSLWPNRVRNNMWRNKATPRSDFELTSGRDNTAGSDGSLSPSSGAVVGKDKDEEAGSSNKTGSGKDRDKDDDKSEPVLYAQRWVQLGILSMLALTSDMVCFSVAANPRVFVSAFDGHSPTELVDYFLITNVMGCFLVTDLTRLFGLRKVMVAASVLMACGCLVKSGIPFADQMPTYPWQVAGTVLVGAAQPFFQCTPPLLSATWFGTKERSLATAVAINFNQVGIGSAFLLGGFMATDAQGLATYFAIISSLSLVLCVAAFLKFEDRPLTPPSASAAAAKESSAALQGGGALQGGNFRMSSLQSLFTFPGNAIALFQKPGFMHPLAAFVTSIGVTNVVSAFTETTLHRAGMMDQLTVDLCGAGFQLSIVLGGIVVGGYVDKTKEFKEVTLACLSATLGLLVLLGLAFGFDLDLPHFVVALALLGLGATAGPVQPINAELAVEVSYPSDETSIEAVQQLCGNLFSALLVPLCEKAATMDYEVLPGMLARPEDMRGDSVVLIALTLASTLYFTSFNAPLKRSEFDAHN